MKPSKICNDQYELFRSRLSTQLNADHPLILLSKLIDWKSLEEEFTNQFVEGVGKPAKPVRLVIGIFMLQHMYGISDENIVYRWVENPYWQAFCGFDYLQDKLPIHPTSLIKWRHRLGESGLQKVLGATIVLAVTTGAIKKKSLQKVIADTTVMPKAIAFPTDAKLYLKSIGTLVKLAKGYEIPLRQTYAKLAPKAFRRRNRYAHARQMKRSQKEERRLKNYLGRILRDFERKAMGKKLDKESLFLVETIKRVYLQKKDDSHKIYSLHEPHVECISKGKLHKKYEFGCKTTIVATHSEGLVLDIRALRGAPYDGHTLEEAIKQAESNSQCNIETIHVDKGYRGHTVKEKNVFISGQKLGMTRQIKTDMKRRQAIEPHIGHMKNDGKLGRNYLKGPLGDALNAVLCGIGHNLRMICNWLAPRRHRPRYCG